MPVVYAKADVRLPGDTLVEVRRSFRAPQALVYRALTEPALVQRWMLGMPGWTMPVCEMDVRTGGAFRWRWRNEAEGTEMGFHGDYVDVEPGVRTVANEYYDPGSVGGDIGDGALITTTLAEHDGATKMTVLMDYHTKASRDAALSTGMTDGMDMSYALFDALMAALQ
jgi:uncharacterized protein YndB with AHSA1/START domain